VKTVSAADAASSRPPAIASAVTTPRRMNGLFVMMVLHERRRRCDATVDDQRRCPVQQATSRLYVTFVNNCRGRDRQPTNPMKRHRRDPGTARCKVGVSAWFRCVCCVGRCPQRSAARHVARSITLRLTPAAGNSPGAACPQEPEAVRAQVSARSRPKCSRDAARDLNHRGTTDERALIRAAGNHTAAFESWRTFRQARAGDAARVAFA